jgi:alpha-methylacyl-CoA racemase
MTGWGATRPLSEAAGHDINYLALAGALAAIGPEGGPPCPPLNLVGDYGGGALYLVFGITCALLERTRSGLGQVVDAAMLDGVASLMANRTSKVASGGGDEAGQDHLDGSAHYYRTYVCSDGRAIAVGAVEPKFYRRRWAALGFPEDAIPGQDRSDWREGGATLAAIFGQKPQSYWTALFADTDACCTPVLPLRESFQHPHVLARETYVERFGIRQPNVAPRLSRTPWQIQGPPCHEPTPLAQVLNEWDCEPILTGDHHGNV